MNITYGLAAQALLVAWIVWKITARAPSRQRRLFYVAAAALSLIPLADGVSAAMALRALWGDPSITTVQLLVLSLTGRPAQIGRAPAAALALFGIGFYILALGLGDFDPYRLGYAAWPLVTILGAAALLAWRRGQPLYLWLLAVDLAAYAVGLHESNNLWDILFDPLLVAAALLAAFRASRR
ncbi:MAG: hypothetical protein Q8O25_03595 [Sulfurisoma sp.]|nr:hypothetical protein [Sulfurisoma sp.]